MKPVCKYDELKVVFRRLKCIFHAEEQTEEADKRDVLVTLVETN